MRLFSLALWNPGRGARHRVRPPSLPSQPPGIDPGHGGEAAFGPPPRRPPVQPMVRSARPGAMVAAAVGCWGLLTACAPTRETGGGDGSGTSTASSSTTGTGTGTGTGGSGTASDTAPRWNRCEVPSDCVLRPNSCCGVCGAPTLEDVDAVHRDYTEAHAEAVCPEPEPCPDCPSAFNPWLMSTCEAMQCEAFDFSDHAYNRCETDEDCRVRVRDCCECGADLSTSNLIAVPWDTQSRLLELICDPNLDCAGCVPDYPDNVSAVCEQGSCTTVVQ